AVWSVAFSPDGKTLAVGTQFNTIHLWEVATGRERRRFAGDRGTIKALAFTPDGRLLASGHDRTALVWDVTALLREGKLPAFALSPTDMKRLWANLASEEASKAFQAIWHLAATPRQTVPFLKEWLRPAAIDRNKIGRLITDLDSNQFAVRQKAEAELEKLGELTEPALRKALQGQPSLELRRRAEKLLEE